MITIGNTRGMIPPVVVPGLVTDRTAGSDEKAVRRQPVRVMDLRGFELFGATIAALAPLHGGRAATHERVLISIGAPRWSW